MSGGFWSGFFSKVRCGSFRSELIHVLEPLRFRKYSFSCLVAHLLALHPLSLVLVGDLAEPGVLV